MRVTGYTEKDHARTHARTPYSEEWSEDVGISSKARVSQILGSNPAGSLNEPFLRSPPPPMMAHSNSGRIFKFILNKSPWTSLGVITTP